MNQKWYRNQKYLIFSLIVVSSLFSTPNISFALNFETPTQTYDVPVNIIQNNFSILLNESIQVTTDDKKLTLPDPVQTFTTAKIIHLDESIKLTTNHQNSQIQFHPTDNTTNLAQLKFEFQRSYHNNKHITISNLVNDNYQLTTEHFPQLILSDTQNVYSNPEFEKIIYSTNIFDSNWNLNSLNLENNIQIEFANDFLSENSSHIFLMLVPVVSLIFFKEEKFKINPIIIKRSMCFIAILILVSSAAVTP